MNAQPNSTSPNLNADPLAAPVQPIAAVAALLLAAFVAGLLFWSPTLGLTVIAVLVMAPLAAIAIWKHPMLGLFVIVFLALGLVPQNLIDLRLPIGGLDLRDLVLLSVLGLLVLQRLLGLRSIVALLPLTPASYFLLAFIALSFVSAFYATRYMDVAGNWAFSEVRPLMYYLVALIAAWATRSRKGLFALLTGLFLMSNLTATVLVLQQFLGRNNPLLETMTGNEWYVRVQSSGDTFGAVRIVPPGHMLMYALTIVAFSLLLYSNQSRWVKRALAFEFIYLNFALLLTYTRAQWLASAIAMFIVIATLPRLRWRQLANRLSLIIVALIVLIVLFGSSASGLLDSVGFLSALNTRISSIFNPSETLASSSLQWRLYETETSLKAIRENPMLGVGVGNSYRDVTLLDGEARGWLTPISNGNFRGLTRFVHNSYLHIAVKMGLPALALFLLFIGAFLLICIRLYRKQRDLAYQRIIIALLASIIGALQWSITEHNLIQVDAVIAIGLMVGIVAAIEALPALETNPTSPQSQPLIPSPQQLAYE